MEDMDLYSRRFVMRSAVISTFETVPSLFSGYFYRKIKIRKNTAIVDVLMLVDTAAEDAKKFIEKISKHNHLARGYQQALANAAGCHQ